MTASQAKQRFARHETHAIFVANPISVSYVYIAIPIRTALATQHYRSFGRKADCRGCHCRGFVEWPQVAFNGKAYWRWSEPEALAKLRYCRTSMRSIGTRCRSTM